VGWERFYIKLMKGERGGRETYIYVMTNRGTRKTYESKDGNAEGSLNNI
jgi:hypothetical protein